jgi:hypothetical protein
VLAVQQYLRGGKSLDDLKSELGINVYHHPDLPLVGVKYNQIDSPKTDPVVRSCRGTVLEKDTWNVVAKPFQRFYNAGEVLDEYKQFDWSNFTCTEKVDGSLMIVYHYAGEWHVNTSGSFGLGECGFSGMNWRELFWKTSGIDENSPKLIPGLTYIFELCTVFNKVVRSYPEPTVFLLSIFSTETLEEMPEGDVDISSKVLKVPRPERYQFSAEQEIRNFLLTKEEYDKTFEGVIIRDVNNLRFKIKTETYVALHHLKDNGNICNPKRLVPLVLAGEVDEIIAYLPEVEPYLRECQAKIDAEWESLSKVWQQYWEIQDQKEFALAIRGKTRFSGILFTLRKQHPQDQTEELLRDLWRSHADGITKVLYG